MYCPDRLVNLLMWSVADGGVHHPRREPFWAGFRAPQAQRPPASMRSARWPGTDDGFAATRLPLEHRVVPVGSRGGFRYTWAATPECCVVGGAPSAAEHRDSKGLATPPRRSQAGVWQPFNVTASDRGAAAATTAPTSPPATDGAGMGGGGSRRPRNSAAPRRVRRLRVPLTERRRRRRWPRWSVSRGPGSGSRATPAPGVVILTGSGGSSTHR